MNLICVFGSSDEWGAWDLEKGGWVNRLRLWFDHNEKYSGYSDDYTEVYNLGISGDNSSGVLKRITPESEARDANMIIVSIGGNDSALPPHDVSVPLSEFSENIKKIIVNAKAITDKVILLGLFHVDESNTAPVSWDKSLTYKNERIGDYNDSLKKVCSSNSIPLIEISDLVKVEDLCDDGLHMNDGGHEKVFLKVRDFLLNNHLL